MWLSRKKKKKIKTNKKRARRIPPANELTRKKIQIKIEKFCKKERRKIFRKRNETNHIFLYVDLGAEIYGKP